MADINRKMAEFVEYAFQAACDGTGFDGGEIQDLLERLGLIVEGIASEQDEIAHNGEFEAGDTIFFLADDVAAFLRPPLESTEAGR